MLKCNVGDTVGTVKESKTVQLVEAVELSGCLMAKECGMLESESLNIWKSNTGQRSEWAPKRVASPNGDGLSKRRLNGKVKKRKP